jgi:histidinol-phosphate aminotransferase
MTSKALHFDEAINPYGCSPRVVEAMIAFARSQEYRFYGEEATGESLRADLAAHFALHPDNFIVYNGAGEGVAWIYIARLLLARGTLVTPYPSYERFTEGARLFTDRVIEVPLSRADWSLPVDRMIEDGRRGEATLGLISNPNNPSGNLLVDAAALEALLDGLPDCLWIIDEAFADYTGVTFVPLVAERRNLVVLRTFSKAYGLAGLRVGYAAAHRSVVQDLARFHIPWGVDSMALVAARAALADQGFLKEAVARIHEDCRAFRRAIAQVPHFLPHPGRANFFLVQLTDIDPARVRAHLADHHVRVRLRPDLPEFVRVTAMTPDLNRRFVDIISTL